MENAELVYQAAVEVLGPPIADVDVKIAAIEEILRLGFIDTDQSQHFFGWLQEQQVLRQCGRVVGPRDTGKSRAAHYYAAGPSGLSGQVVYVKAPSNCSSRTIFSKILKGIHHAASFGKRQDIRPRTAGSLVDFGYQQVIVDNAQHLMREAVADLKDLFDDTRIPIVLVGVADVESRLDGYGLFESFPNLYPFEGLMEEDLRQTLMVIEQDILQLPELSGLAEGALFEALVKGSEGRIGKLVKIVHKATLKSLKRGHGKVDGSILMQSAMRYGQRYKPTV